MTKNRIVLKSRKSTQVNNVIVLCYWWMGSGVFLNVHVFVCIKYLKTKAH